MPLVFQIIRPLYTIMCVFMFVAAAGNRSWSLLVGLELADEAGGDIIEDVCRRFISAIPPEKPYFSSSRLDARRSGET